MDKPDPSSILDAADLEVLESQHLAALDAGDEAEALPANTLQDAVTALRRIAYHRRKTAEIIESAELLIAPLQAQIDQILAWSGQQQSDIRDRIAFHESRLVAYYQANPPTKTQTLKLPGGNVSMGRGKPKWLWENEDALIADLLQVGHPAVRQVPTLDKNKLKAATKVQEDGTVLETETGQILPGVRVVPGEKRYDVEVDG